MPVLGPLITDETTMSRNSKHAFQTIRTRLLASVGVVVPCMLDARTGPVT